MVLWVRQYKVYKLGHFEKKNFSCGVESNNCHLKSVQLFVCAYFSMLAFHIISSCLVALGWSAFNAIVFSADNNGLEILLHISLDI